MTDPSLQENILIVEADLGFVAMLCQKLTEAGFVAVPAMVAERALPLLKEMKISRVDLLIAKLALPGTNDLIQALHAENEHLKIIAIADATPTTTAAIEGFILKPSGMNQGAGCEWLQMVRRTLAVRRHSAAAYSDRMEPHSEKL